MRKAFLYLSLISTVCFSAISRDFTYDGLTYTVLSEYYKTVETKQGEFRKSAAGNKVSGDVVIPDIVYDGYGNSYTVIQIGYYGFYNCEGIKSITLPSTLRTISSEAMKNIGATEIVVPAGVESIGNEAFSGCPNLTTAILECTEVITGDNVFDGCNALESVELKGVRSLSEGFFSRCRKLRDVRLPKCLTSIEDFAFYNCTGLESIWIDATTPPTIKSDAFSNAKKFTLYVPSELLDAYKNSDWAQYANEIISSDFTYDGLIYSVLSERDKTVETKQGVYSKAGNEVSGDVVIPDIVYDSNGDSYTVIQIGYYGFYNCEGIKSITLPSTLRTISSEAMKNIGATEIVVPAGVESIGNEAFSGCPNLTTAILECTEVITGDNVFDGCNALESVELKGVRSLSEGFFSRCRKLRDVRLPKCLTSIEDYAFGECTGLESIWIDATTPPTLYYNNAFSGANKFILYVPSALLDAYKNSNWAKYAAVITSDGQVFNYTYESTSLKYCVLDAEEKTCLVCKYLDSTNENLIIPENVTFEDEAYSVVAIAPEVFKDCDQFTSVELPASIEQIGDYAFSGCAITSVEIPASVKEIGSSAFYRCPNLTTATLECTDVTTGSEVFAECPLLESVELKGVSTLSACSFYGCSKLREVRLPECLTSIEQYAFRLCRGLETIWVDATTPPTLHLEAFNSASKFTLSVPVNSVDAYKNSDWAQYAAVITSDGQVFNYTYESTKLGYKVLDANEKTCEVVGYLDSTNENLIIPDKVSFENETYSVVSIAADAFKNCNKFTSVELPASIEQIGDYAFSGCAITSVEIPASVENIGSGVFSGCAITSVEIPASVKEIGSYAFSGCAITSVEIPASVKEIGSYAFFDCPNLTTASLESTDVTTGDYVFANCPLLESVELNGVSTLSTRSFSGCGNLREVWLPECLTSIQGYAFQVCRGLESIWIDATTPPTIDPGAFSGASKFTLYVPYKSVDAYKNSDWAQYANEITAGQVFNYTYESTSLKYHVWDREEKTCEVIDYLESTNENLIIPENVTFEDEAYSVVAIAPEVFKDCDQFTSVELPASIEQIGDYAFSGCAITSVEIPASVTEIGRYAFFGCASLEAIFIPKSVGNIGSSAFQNCGNLNSLIIEQYPQGITIGENVFKDTPNLKYLSLGRNVTDDLNITSLEELIIGNLVTELSSFADNGNLRRVVLGNGFSEIPEMAFKNCAIEEIVIPEKVISIGASAFEGNPLRTISMGPNITSIGSRAFYGSDYQIMNVGALIPPTADSGIVSNYTGKIFVPQRSLAAYEYAPGFWQRVICNPLIDIEEIQGDVENIDGKVGDIITLTVTVSPENVSMPYVCWSSTNTDVAYVDPFGNVLLVGPTAEYGECKIQATTLYADGPMLEIDVASSYNSGIEEVSENDNGSSNGITDLDKAVEVYNLNGTRIATSVEGLVPGIYIVRQGNTVKKIAVK